MSLANFAICDISDVTAQTSYTELEKLMNKGHDLYNIGDYGGAIKMYDRALMVKPHDKDVLYFKNTALDAMREFNEANAAIKHYDKKLVLEPNDAYTLVEKGKALYKIGNYSESINSFDRALMIKPNDTSIFGMKRNALIMNNTSDQREVDDLVSKGDIARIYGNYSSALDYYDRALGINPDDPLTLQMKAFTLSDLGNYTGALYYYNKIQGIVGDERFRLSEIGDVLFGLGNYTGALSYYEESLESFPYDQVAIDGKANVLSILNLISETNSRQNSGSDISSNITENSKTPDLRLGTYLLKQAEGYPGFKGEYQVNEKVGVYVIFGSDDLGNYVHKLQDSTPNLVNLSDSQIGVDFAFGILVHPNSTIESIERIEGLYDVKYVDTQPNYKRFIAFSDSPLSINNTQYSDLTFEVKNFNNNTGYLFIDGYK